MRNMIDKITDMLGGNTSLELLNSAREAAEYEYIMNPSKESNDKRKILEHVVTEAQIKETKAEKLGHSIPAIQREHVAIALTKLKVKGLVSDEDAIAVMSLYGG